MLRATAAIAAWEYVRRELKLSDEQVEVLVAAAREPGWPSANSFILWALEAAAYNKLDDLLEELSNADSAEVRFDANYRLLERGRDTKVALFADLDKLGWNVDFGVERLWWARERLDLTGQEEEMLRAHIQSKVEEHRAACRGEHPYNSALFLFRRLEEGFPAEPDDVDLLGEAVSHVRSQHERINAVRAVAWFDNDRAREWLERLSLEPYQPSVRREAHRQLKRLTAR
jgi:hypothetical protein